MLRLIAIDLCAATEPGGPAADRTAAQGAGPPEGVFQAPLGYRFVPTERWPEPAPRRVEVGPAGCFADGPEHADRPRTPAGTTGPRGARRAVVPIPGPRAGGRREAGRLLLEIDEGLARVGIDEREWPEHAEAVLLAIAQFWRFQQIDRRLAELGDWAGRDLRESRPFGGLHPARMRGLRRRRRSLRGLVLEFPGVEGPLTDPRGFLGSRRSVALYRRIARGLDLHRWRDRIDEEVEVLEAAVDAAAEDQADAVSLALQVALELLIVVALVIDVALHLREAMAD